MTARPSSRTNPLIRSRSRVMRVRGRTSSGKSWKYILFFGLGQAVRVVQHDHAVAHRHPPEVDRGGLGPLPLALLVGGDVAEEEHVEVVDGDSFPNRLAALNVAEVGLAVLVPSFRGTDRSGSDVLVGVVGEITDADGPSFVTAVGGSNAEAGRGVPASSVLRSLTTNPNRMPAPVSR